MRNTQRLDKILANFGYGTRREVKQLVKDRAVKVDGSTVNDSSMHIVPENSIIEVNGRRLNYRKYIYLMLNKPQGVISATFDTKHKTVVDIIPDEFRCFDLFPAGRLDIDTEGMLLMTNDGQLAHEILAPRKHVPKIYYALVEGEVTQEDVESFKKGLVLDDGYKTLPSDLNILRQGENSEIELTIFEGKFHQVKRMFEAVGKKVKFLKRMAMGGLKLDEHLKPGECREMTQQEVEIIKRNDRAQLEENS